MYKPNLITGTDRQTIEGLKQEVYKPNAQGRLCVYGDGYAYTYNAATKLLTISIEDAVIRELVGRKVTGLKVYGFRPESTGGAACTITAGDGTAIKSAYSVSFNAISGNYYQIEAVPSNGTYFIDVLSSTVSSSGAVSVVGMTTYQRRTAGGTTYEFGSDGYLEGEDFQLSQYFPAAELYSCTFTISNAMDPAQMAQPTIVVY